MNRDDRLEGQVAVVTGVGGGAAMARSGPFLQRSLLDMYIQPGVQP